MQKEVVKYESYYYGNKNVKNVKEGFFVNRYTQDLYVFVTRTVVFTALIAKMPQIHCDINKFGCFN